MSNNAKSEKETIIDGIMGVMPTNLRQETYTAIATELGKKDIKELSEIAQKVLAAMLTEHAPDQHIERISDRNMPKVK